MKTTKFTRAMEVIALILMVALATASWSSDTTAHKILYCLAAALTGAWIVIDTTE